ncbi:sporulation integral membrane protein YtvI [Domibacillus iocasae]|uniref:Sporulation integral membrane protein YtvI n=1 Tax=Domibacillus iocasae TaxID=1714016 RepID=A0A1E7DMC0_9BACI|nr:sporulation integral membrane protein YtvI [Domibacillus iocasae]OES44155.1 sporulation integral membrane protein YtvI [Domibacillus iocasae]
MRMIVQYVLVSAVLLSVYWLLPIFKPFLAGAFFAAVLHKPAHFIQKKASVSRSTAVFASLVWILCLLSAGLFLFGWISARTASHIHYVIPHYIPVATAHLEQLINNVTDFLTEDQKGLLLQSLYAVETAIDNTIEEYAGKWLLIGTSYFLALSGTAAELLIAILAAFFIAKDGPSFITILPESIREKTAIAANDFSTSFYAYGYAQAQLFAATFAAACIGFFLLHIPHVLELAFLTAVLEFLPIIGSSLLFLPWIFFCLLTGQTNIAIFAGVLYAALTIMRQLLEPKLISDSAGLHPLAVLFAAFAGYQLAGVFGLVTGPLFWLACSSVYRSRLLFTER